MRINSLRSPAVGLLAATALVFGSFAAARLFGVNAQTVTKSFSCKNDALQCTEDSSCTGTNFEKTGGCSIKCLKPNPNSPDSGELVQSGTADCKLGTGGGGRPGIGGVLE
jgi:hypothetical protein